MRTIWAIAIAKPCPIGEIIATLVSAGVLTYYILTKWDCIDEYVICADNYHVYDYCSSCLQYCVVQAYCNCP
ncbi:MAG: hypothetical protein N4A49_00140 [Marinifilaceae bacterium]|nr:hypothetical protein [Marinifilaceae bacterium]